MNSGTVAETTAAGHDIALDGCSEESGDQAMVRFSSANSIAVTAKSL